MYYYTDFTAITYAYRADSSMLKVMDLLPEQITKVVQEFSKLPGIGGKSAERLTFHLLRSSKASPEALGRALLELKNELHYCEKCQMVASETVCSICQYVSRDATTILVVENPLDVVAFEKTDYQGVYHVLHGSLSPIDGFGPEQLKLHELIERCKKNPIAEVIVATNPNVEGEATARYIEQQLKPIIAKITRLAHGLPMGADIEFADQITLNQAITGRRSI